MSRQIKIGDWVRVLPCAVSIAKKYIGQIVQVIEINEGSTITVKAQDEVEFLLVIEGHSKYKAEYELVWWVKPEALEEALAVAKWTDENRPCNTKEFYVENYVYWHNRNKGYSNKYESGDTIFSDCPDNTTEITFEEFKQMFLIEMKKIKGYKNPTDLYNGYVKAGSLWTSFDKSSYSINTEQGELYLPTEIVETWEPVYEDKIKPGDWVITTTTIESGYHKHKAGEVFQVDIISDTMAIFMDGLIRCGVYLTRLRKATKEEIAIATSATEVLTLGNHRLKIEVSKKGVYARGVKIETGKLSKIYSSLTSSLGSLSSWNIEIVDPESIQIRIGCTTENNIFTLGEIKRLLDTYERLSK